MIAIQKIGKSFMGALNYNLKKLNHPDRSKRAQLLGTNFTSLDVRQIKREVELLRELRPNLNRYVYHTSLNFSKVEQQSLSNELLLALAQDYLNASGFKNNQYLIFRHYDADHPHVHLLVNRITFDGNVVSDSNNYKKSEAILRELEHRYNLITVEQSNHIILGNRNKMPIERSKEVTVELYNHTAEYQRNSILWERNNNIPGGLRNPVSLEHSNNISEEQNNSSSQEPDNDISVKQNNQVSIERPNKVSRKSPTRDEIAMILRTGKSSNKMLLQELLKNLINKGPGSISEFIRAGEKIGIQFLFNQASTGRVSGITYFFKDFKAKGQALGNQFKWAELIKKVNYSLSDNIAIQEANKRTLDIYGTIMDSQANKVNNETVAGVVTEKDDEHLLSDTMAHKNISDNGEHIVDEDGLNVTIADDVDDEAMHGKRRNRRNRR